MWPWLISPREIEQDTIYYELLESDETIITDRYRRQLLYLNEK